MKFALPIATAFLFVALNTNAASLDAEAQRQASFLWEKSFEKCGDAYFTKLRPASNQLPGYPALFAQYRGPAGFIVVADPLSTADRANGVEWEGELKMKDGIYRSSRSLSLAEQNQGLVLPGGKWGKWLSGSPESYRLRKKQGTGWEVGPNEFFSDYKAISDVPTKKPACSELPE